jgi:hypothetical protein
LRRRRRNTRKKRWRKTKRELRRRTRKGEVMRGEG